MLDSIVIKNFRLFKWLELKRLNRVNLIVGKNHSGKSTLLEAVRLYASGVDLEVLINLLDARQELPSRQDWRLRSNGKGPAFRHLFHGHKMPGFNEDGIWLGPAEAPEQQVHIRPVAYHREAGEGVHTSRQRVDPLDTSVDLSELEVLLVVEESAQTRRLINLNIEPRDALQRRHLVTRQLNTEIPPVLLVAVQSTDLDELASLWDTTSLTDLEEDVIAGLQLIAPDIRGIAFIEDKGALRGNRRLPMVKQKGVQGPIPLKTMGDGILRLFHIVLTLVNARGGVLLIDEMENGLHWSLQPKVWNLVFQLAEKLDVQVFATTHSKDCVRGFEAAWRGHPETGAFIRLESKNDGIVATPYNCETLSDSLEMAVEIR